MKALEDVPNVQEGSLRCGGGFCVRAAVACNLQEARVTSLCCRCTTLPCQKEEQSGAER